MIKALMQATREGGVGGNVIERQATGEPCNPVEKVYGHPPIRVLCGKNSAHTIVRWLLSDALLYHNLRRKQKWQNNPFLIAIILRAYPPNVRRRLSECGKRCAKVCPQATLNKLAPNT